MEALQEAQQLKAPMLRKSTRERVEEAQKERQRTEQVRLHIFSSHYVLFFHL